MVEWKPMETVAFAGVGGLTLVGLAWAAAWYAVAGRSKDIGLDPDALAGQTLGRMLAYRDITPKGVEEVAKALRGLPADQLRIFACAVSEVGYPGGAVGLARVLGFARGLAQPGSGGGQGAEPGDAPDPARR